jgi:hypothetical protein
MNMAWTPISPMLLSFVMMTVKLKFANGTVCYIRWKDANPIDCKILQKIMNFQVISIPFISLLCNFRNLILAPSYILYYMD